MGIKTAKFLSPFIEENTYIILDEGSSDAAVIDPGILNDDIAELLKGCNLRYIMLTHAHGDHIKDIMKYKAAYPDAQVVVSDIEKDYLADPALNGSANMPIAPIGVDADVLTDDSTRLKLGDSEVEFILTPGHTPGSQCIRIGDKMFTGDTLFFMSVGATHFPGGDWDSLKKSISEKLFSLPDDITVYPGHGPETSVGYEKRANPFV